MLPKKPCFKAVTAAFAGLLCQLRPLTLTEILQAAPAKGVGAGEGNNLLVVEAHAVEDIPQVLRALGRICKAVKLSIVIHNSQGIFLLVVSLRLLVKQGT